MGGVGDRGQFDTKFVEQHTECAIAEMGLNAARALGAAARSSAACSYISFYDCQY